MKKIVFAIVSVMMAISVAGWARTNSVVDDLSSIQLHFQNDKVKIKKEELPEPAIKTLEGDAYKGWTFASAYKLKNGEFEVELKKGAEVQTVKFDKDGNLK